MEESPGLPGFTGFFHSPIEVFLKSFSVKNWMELGIGIEKDGAGFITVDMIILNGLTWVTSLFGAGICGNADHRVLAPFARPVAHLPRPNRKPRTPHSFFLNKKLIFLS